MPSRRISPLPPNWPNIREAVFMRDGYRCVQIRNDGNRCYNVNELECDHIGDRDDHSMDNLQTLCKGHHAAKTGRQGAQMSVLRRFGPKMKQNGS